MKLTTTRILQLIFLGLALFFVATNQFMMALAMCLIVISVDSMTKSTCEKSKRKVKNESY